VLQWTNGVYEESRTFVSMLARCNIRRITNLPPLSSTIKSHRLTFFGHLARMGTRMQMPGKPSSNLLRRTGGDHRGTTWMKNIHDDLSSPDLGIHEARDLAQNRPLCRLLSLPSATTRSGALCVLCVCVSVCLPQVYFWNYTSSEVTTLWCCTNLFINVIVIIIYSVL